MVNSFVVALDIAVIINILQEIIKIFHEEILKALNLYWSQKDASKKNNSLNGHLVNKGSSYLLLNKISFIFSYFYI